MTRGHDGHSRGLRLRLLLVEVFVCVESSLSALMRSRGDASRLKDKHFLSSSLLLYVARVVVQSLALWPTYIQDAGIANLTSQAGTCPWPSSLGIVHRPGADLSIRIETAVSSSIFETRDVSNLGSRLSMLVDPGRCVGLCLTAGFWSKSAVDNAAL